MDTHMLISNLILFHLFSKYAMIIITVREYCVKLSLSVGKTY